MVKDSDTECWVPSNFGTANEEVVELTRVPPSNTRCDHIVPSDFIPNDARRGLCAKAQRCIISSGTLLTIDPSNSMYFMADPGVDNVISGGLSTSLTSMGLFDPAYATLSECQSANPDRIVGFIPRAGGPPVFTKFRSLDLCKTAYNTAVASLLGTARFQGSPNVSGNCSWVPDGVLLNRALPFEADKTSCSCRKCSYILGFLDVSVCWGFNVLSTGIVDLTTPKEKFDRFTTIAENLNACESAHPDRYQNKNTRQCYTTPDLCQQADTSSCDITKNNHLFVRQPSSPDVIYTPAEIDTKNNQLKSCSLTRKSFSQCLNEVFGAGPTSTSLSTDNFYLCQCSDDPSCTPVPGGTCPKICTLNKARLANFNIIKPITIQSPLALINVVVNFLFWAAVVIFIINILSAAFSYIRNADQPDKLKEASDRITGTIFGFVFLLVAAGVINYIIRTLTTFGLGL